MPRLIVQSVLTVKLKELDQIPRVKSNTDLGRWLERGWKGLSVFLVYFELRINI